MVANTNHYCIDASALLATILPDEKQVPLSDQINQIIANPKSKIFSTHLLAFEFGNTLKSAVLTKRLDQSRLKTMVNQFIKLPIVIKPTDLRATLSLSLKLNLSFYDASYLYLAKSMNLELLTLDKSLQTL